MSILVKFKTWRQRHCFAWASEFNRLAELHAKADERQHHWLRECTVTRVANQELRSKQGASEAAQARAVELQHRYGELISKVKVKGVVQRNFVGWELIVKVNPAAFLQGDPADVAASVARELASKLLQKHYDNEAKKPKREEP